MSLTALADYFAVGADPVQMARKLGLEPEPWHAEFLRSRSNRILLNCCRQSGKTTMASLVAVWTVLYQPNSLVLIFSPTQEQSAEMYRKCRSFLSGLDWPANPEQETQLTLTLENGSRIVSKSGVERSARGYSAPRLIVVDEASRVEDETFGAIEPMLAGGGRLFLLSTPNGARGFYHERWASSEQWQRFTVTAKQSARITPEFLEERRRTQGWWFFRQEWFCEFTNAATAAFDTDAIKAAVNPDIKPLGVLGREWI